MRKIEKEKRFDFRDIVPLICGIIVFATLVAALVFVINYDVEKLIEEEKFETFIEEEIDTSKLTCGSDSIQAAKEIVFSYSYMDYFMGYGEAIDEFSPNTEVEAVYESVPLLKAENVDKDNFELIVQIDDKKNREEMITVDETELDILYYLTDPTRKFHTYTIEVKKKGCNEVLRKKIIKPGIVNDFSNTINCYNYPEFKWCSRLLYEDIPGWDTFKKELQVYVSNLQSGKIVTKTTSIGDELLESIRDGYKPYETTLVTTKQGETTTSTTTKKENKKDKIKDSYIQYGLIVLASVIVIGAAVYFALKRRGDH